MTINPLKQYFRRPSLYIRLPSLEKYYDESVLETTENQELPIYPMTAVDEITAKTPDAVFNGTAVVDIIHSCVPNIKNAWDINTIDLDAILIAIRIATNGEELEVDSTCPACSQEGTYVTNLISLLETQQTVDFDKELIIDELSIRFKPLTFKEINYNGIKQYEIQKAAYNLSELENSEQTQAELQKQLTSLNELTTKIFTDTILSITTPETTVTNKEHISEFLSQCDKNTFKSIKDFSINLKNQNTLKPFKLKCSSCNHEYEQQLILNIADFFE